MPADRRQCKLCPQEIFFVVSQNGKPMPLNVELTTVVVLDGDGKVSYMTRGHVPHHISCPRAADFRKKPEGSAT